MVVVFFLSRFQHGGGGGKGGEKEQMDLARNVLFIILKGWDLDLYFYSFLKCLYLRCFFFWLLLFYIVNKEK